MELTQNKFQAFKRDISWYSHTDAEDAYGFTKVSYPETPVIINSIMITPYQRDDTAIELYGETDKQKAQCVYYGTENIKKLDKIVDGETEYKVTAVLKYQTHQIIELEMME